MQQPRTAWGGAAEWGAGCVVAILPGAVEERLRAALGKLHIRSEWARYPVRRHDPGAGATSLPPALGDERAVAVAPARARVAQLQVGQHAGRRGEGGFEVQDTIAYGRLDARIAAVERFDPAESGGSVLPPMDAVRPG